MRDNNINLQDNYVDLQHNYVEIQVNCNQITIIQNLKIYIYIYRPHVISKMLDVTFFIWTWEMMNMLT